MIHPNADAIMTVRSLVRRTRLRFNLPTAASLTVARYTRCDPVLGD
jgi:hypothetical protein